jgi:hypothetical protein
VFSLALDGLKINIIVILHTVNYELTISYNAAKLAIKSLLCYHRLMMRNARGQFTMGHSGNAGGRPKDEHKVSELARSYTAEAIDTLVELMRNGKDERVRGTAAQALLDRGWGKAKVEVVTNEEPDNYLAALQAVSERVKARRQACST